MKKPLAKGQSYDDYVKAEARAFISQMSDMIQKKGMNAAWKMMFKTICDEGQNVREGSPVALIVYHMYVAVAVGFLQTSPDKDKIAQLLLQVREDIMEYHTQFKLLESSFTNDELIQMCAVLKVMSGVTESLVDLFKKMHYQK